jgi:hypothetical protein
MFKVKSVENNCIEQIIVRPCKEEELENTADEE